MPEIKKYLNRDGLDEYNSLLPHSSAEMQTYVNAWLDEHPEATTTVQDGAITEPKLADKSVSLRTLADDTVHMLRGAILTGNLSGNVLTADDAYSAPPVALTVEGKSTQDSTPTPESPVEIVSLEQVNLHFDGKNLLNPSTLLNGYINNTGTATGTTATYQHNDFLRAVAGQKYRISQGGVAFTGGIRTAFYDEAHNVLAAYPQQNLTNPVYTAPENTAYIRASFNGPYADKAMIEIDRGSYDGFMPYVGQSVLLNLTQALRSLSSYAHDDISFSYLRPSTREGWAWYTPTFTKRINELTFDETESWRNYNYPSGPGYYTSTKVRDRAMQFKLSNLARNADTGAQGLNTCYFGGAGEVNFVGVSDSAPSLADWVALVTATPAVIQYALADAYITTETLDPVELPFTAAPDFTIWNDPSTGLQMEYVRNSNIVIQNIEQAIADQ